jgi:TetR/AcrR family transcriptional regulator
VRTRLAASERREHLLEAACTVFSRGSYRGVTTAEIAREAGVSEPILYRHFASKQDLYLACLAEAWKRMRAAWAEVLEQEPNPAGWLPAMGDAFLRLSEQKVFLSSLWVQSLAEAGENAEIAAYLRAHLRDVHDFVAEVIGRCQASGHIPRERDAQAEAWVFISLGLLNAIGRRLGGLAEPEFERIRAARRAWLTGAA